MRRVVPAGQAPKRMHVPLTWRRLFWGQMVWQQRPQVVRRVQGAPGAQAARIRTEAWSIQTNHCLTEPKLEKQSIQARACTMRGPAQSASSANMTPSSEGLKSNQNVPKQGLEWLHYRNTESGDQEAKKDSLPNGGMCAKKINTYSFITEPPAVTRGIRYRRRTVSKVGNIKLSTHPLNDAQKQQKRKKWREKRGRKGRSSRRR